MSITRTAARASRVRKAPENRQELKRVYPNWPRASAIGMNLRAIRQEKLLNGTYGPFGRNAKGVLAARVLEAARFCLPRFGDQNHGRGRG